MKNLARNQRAAVPALEYALVIEESDDGYIVEGPDGSYPARQAAGCLLEPRPGDLALVSLDGDGRSYILNILERDDRAPARLRFPGDVTLAAPEGSVSLAARAGLHLSGRTFSLRAQEAEARIEVFSLVGRFWHAQMERAKIVGHTLDSIFHRLVSRLHSSYRYVEDHEEVQAESMRYLVDGTMTIQTHNTIHTAEEHIKLDADQIHLA
ncbi:MAG: DUF3540 domain-containing protein [Thermodesulfobacteriota bacterium]